MNYPEKKTNMAFLAVAVLTELSLLLTGQTGWDMLQYAILGIVLLVVSVIDYYFYVIPDKLLVAALALYILLSALAGDSVLEIGSCLILQGALASLPLLLFVLLADSITGMETMGFGDIKLFYVLGVYLGAAEACLTLFLACIVALIWNVILLHHKKRQMFPFGPSISIAAWLVILWGKPVLEWYTGLWG